MNPTNRRDFVSAALASAALVGRAPGAASETAPTGDGRPIRIAMLLYRGMTALDVVGPHAILAGLAPGSLHLVAKAIGPVPSDTGLDIVATESFETCPRDIDVLFVPGGDGTPEQMRDADTLAFPRDRARGAAWITSVCTGSLILGAAGLLEGYRATAHWCVHDAVLPRLSAIPVDARVVFDRNRATAAGVSAGLDFALALAERLRGEAYARTSQLVMEYAPQPPFDAGTPASAGPAIKAAADSILDDLVSGATAASRSKR